MLMGELATAVKYKLPIKVVVIKNNTLGQIKWEQMVFLGNPEYGCDLQPIDFARYAEAVGVPGFTLDKAEDARGGRRRGVRPSTARRWSSASSTRTSRRCRATPSTTQALGFAKSLLRGEKDRCDIIKTVLKNKIREVI